MEDKLKILIINGPNLNMLGKREPVLYGNRAFENYFHALEAQYDDISFEYFQSNHEGEIIDKIQAAANKYDGIILNPGGLAHTSVVLRDAILAIDTAVIEVHITNVFKREEFRHTLLLADACKGVIMGLGLEGYRLAAESFRTEL